MVLDDKLAFNKNTDFFAYHNWFPDSRLLPSFCVYDCQNNCNADITIAIPTYKRASLLRETIDSALSQKGVVKYSVLVLDNNPERGDETEILMATYKGQNVSYYKNSHNLKMGGNWNRCVEIVKSPWIILLHDDDTISPIFVSEVSKAISLFPNAGVIQTKKTFQKENLWQQESEIKYLRRGKLDFYSGSGVSGVPSGVAYRKECVLSLGGFPYDNYQGYAYWFHVRSVEKYSYYTIDAPLTYYRVSQQNASANSKLHTIWLYYEYLLLHDMMKHYHIPYFIYEPYIQNHVERQQQGWRSMWGSDFEVPTEYIEKKNYPAWRIKVSQIFLLMYAGVIRSL